jgi:hypothetical protein
MVSIRRYLTRIAWSFAVSLGVTLIVVMNVFAVPVQFQWRSYDGTGATSYGVYDADDATPLQGGYRVQLIYVGLDGVIDPPWPSGAPSGDDVLLTEGTILNNASLPPPLRDRGYFDEGFSYDTTDWPDGTLVYVRAWNNTTALSATHYGDTFTSPLIGNEGFTWPRWHTNTSAPTAVTLSSFTATPGDGEILIEWATASEQDLQGFNLYRAEKSPDGCGTGSYVQLNDTLIQPTQEPFGAEYVFPDQAVVAGVPYCYWLEDVVVGGVTHLHGPAEAALAAEHKIYLPLIVRQ